MIRSIACSTPTRACGTIAVTADSKAEAYGALFGALLAADDACQAVLGGHCVITGGPERWYASVVYDVDYSDVTLDGPIHCARKDAARRAAYRHLEANLELGIGRRTAGGGK